MSALERMMLCQNDPEAALAYGRQQAEKMGERIKSGHARMFDCTTWEVWTEKNVRLMEGGRADITFEGCREHHVACQM